MIPLYKLFCLGQPKPTSISVFLSSHSLRYQLLISDVRRFFLFLYEVWICARSTSKCFSFLRFTCSGRNPTSTSSPFIFTSIIAYIYLSSSAGSSSFCSARAKRFLLSSLYDMTFARTEQNSQSDILFHSFLFHAVTVLTSCSLVVSTYLGLKFCLDQPKFHIYRRTTNASRV